MGWKKIAGVSFLFLALVALIPFIQAPIECCRDEDGNLICPCEGGVPLTADAGPDKTVFPYTYSAVSGSYSGGTPPVTVQWSFPSMPTGTCLFNGESAPPSNTSSLSVYCNDAGNQTYTGTFSAWDSQGNSAEDSMNWTISGCAQTNQSPYVKLDYPDSSSPVVASQYIQFDANDVETPAQNLWVTIKALKNVSADQTTQSEFSTGTFTDTDTNSDGVLHLKRDAQGNYASAGTFLSQPLCISSADCYANGWSPYTSDWEKAAWVASDPNGTELSVQVRAGACEYLNQYPACWSPWTAPSSANPATLSLLGARWIQYQITMNSSDPTQSPVLSDISIITGSPDLPNSHVLVDRQSLGTLSCSFVSGKALDCPYTWNAGSAAFGVYSIRTEITDSGNGCSGAKTNAGTSVSFFKLPNTAPSVKVLSPNGGERLAGVATPIDFNAQDDQNESLSASIYWSTAPGARQNLIVGNIPLDSTYCTDLGGGGTITPDTCSYVWFYPAGFDQNAIYIDVQVADSVYTVLDSSDSNFSAQYSASAQQLFINRPTYSDYVYKKAESLLSFQFGYILPNPKEYYVSVQNHSKTASICAAQKTAGLVGGIKTIDGNCSVSSGATEGFYDITVQLKSYDGNTFSSTQYNSVRIDNTPPQASLSGVSSQPVYENEIGLLCADAFSYCNQTKWYYFNNAPSCSQSKSNYAYSTNSETLLVDANHSDYLCAWFEDAAENKTVAVSDALRVDVNAVIVTVGSGESARQALSAKSGDCTVSFGDRNTVIDCPTTSNIKIRFRPTGLEQTFKERLRLAVGPFQEIVVVSEQSFTEQQGTKHFIQFIGPETKLAAGKNNAFSFSAVKSYPAILLKRDGRTENGLLQVKVQ